MQRDYSKLDNPVWYSLTETHQNFSIDYGNLKFYHPDYCPFGGFKTAEDITRGINEYSTIVERFFIVGNKPELSTRVQLKQELVCLQMVIEDKINLEASEHITTLTQEHTEALFQLVTSVQPGYFKRKTALLGSYVGIFKNDQLISVTGERLKMNDFTEVSAIITDPQHTGKGYAKQLIAHTVNKILNENKSPYLHVVETNIGAVKLYEKLGFKSRRKISFWNITKQEQ